MTKHPVALAIALAFATSATLSGCDRASNLTEQEHIQRAKDFEDKGNLKGSIIELKNVLLKNPESAQARLLLGQVYLKAGLGAEAEKELSQAEKLGVNHASIKPQLGKALLLMGEYKRVLEEIQPNQNTGKPLALIHSHRGFAYLSLGQKDEAEIEFNAADKAMPNLPETLLGRARIAISQRDVINATRFVDNALNIDANYTDAWLFKAALLDFQNKPEEALAATKKVVEINPNSLAARIRLITYYFGKQDIENARTQVKAASTISPRNLEVHYYQALLSFNDKKFEEASDNLQSLLNGTPNHLPSLILSGSTSFQQGKYEQARQHYSRAVGIAPQNAQVRKLLAKTLLKLGDNQEALETLKPLNPNESSDVKLLALAGEAAYEAKDYALATQYLESSVKLAPDNAALRTGLAMSREKAGNTGQAIEDLEKAAEADKQYYKADILLALGHIKRGELDRALVAIANLEKKLPNNALTHNLRAGAYLGNKDFANARKSLEKALAIQPANFFASINLARLDLVEKKPEAARKRFESLLKHDQTNIQAMMALADLAANDNNEKDSINWLEKAAKADSKAIAPRAKLAYHYLNNKDAKKALGIAKATFNDNQENPEAINLLGNVYLATGDKANALITYNQLVKRLPDSFDAQYKLALTQIESSQYGPARASLKKALQIKPDSIQAQDALIRLNLAEKKVEEAIKIAREMQRKHPRSPIGYDREGIIYSADKQFEQAADAYDKALSAGAGSAGLIKLQNAYRQAGQHKMADQKLTAWLKQHPNDPVAKEYAAEYFMNIGRNKESIAHYEALLRQASSNAKILNNLAVLYQREKDQRALATAEKAYKLAPEHPGIQDTLGWILVDEGQAQRGVEILRKAVAKAPNSATLRYHYAVALYRINKKAEAKQALEKVIASGQKIPELDDAKLLLKSLN